ncbi:MAG: CHAT domain-containing protein [Bacteroidota bacterium]
MPIFEIHQLRYINFFSNSKFEEGRQHFLGEISGLPFLDEHSINDWPTDKLYCLAIFTRFSLLCGNANSSNISSEKPVQTLYDALQVIRSLFEVEYYRLLDEDLEAKMVNKHFVDRIVVICECMDKLCNFYFYQGHNLKGIRLGLQVKALKEKLHEMPDDLKVGTHASEWKNFANRLRLDRTNIILGKNYRKHGNAFAAIFSFLRAIKNHQELGDAKPEYEGKRISALIAQVYLDQGNYRSAKTIIKKFITAYEKDTAYTVYKGVALVSLAKTSTTPYEQQDIDHHDEPNVYKPIDFKRFIESFEEAEGLFEKAELHFKKVALAEMHRYKASLYTGKATLYYYWGNLIADQDQGVGSKAKKYWKLAEEYCLRSAISRRSTFRLSYHSTIIDAYNLLIRVRWKLKDYLGGFAASVAAINSGIVPGKPHDFEAELADYSPDSYPKDHFINQINDALKGDTDRIHQNPLSELPVPENELPLNWANDDPDKTEQYRIATSKLMHTLEYRLRLIQAWSRSNHSNQDSIDQLIRNNVLISAKWFRFLDLLRDVRPDTDNPVSGWEDYENLYKLHLVDHARAVMLKGLEIMAKRYRPGKKDTLFSEEEVANHYILCSKTKLPRSGRPLHEFSRLELDKEEDLSARDQQYVRKMETLYKNVKNLTKALVEPNTPTEKLLDEAQEALDKVKNQNKDFTDLEVSIMDQFGRLKPDENRRNLRTIQDIKEAKNEEAFLLNKFNNEFRHNETDNGAVICFLLTNRFIFSLVLYSGEQPVRLIRYNVPGGRTYLRKKVNLLHRALDSTYWEEYKNYLEYRTVKKDSWIVPQFDETLPLKAFKIFYTLNKDIYESCINIYNDVWKPLLSFQKGALIDNTLNRLYIIPNDCLARVPFDILFDNQKPFSYHVNEDGEQWSDQNYLIDRHSITYYPSIVSLLNHHGNDNHDYIGYTYNSKLHADSITRTIFQMNTLSVLGTFIPSNDGKDKRFVAGYAGDSAFHSLAKDLREKVDRHLGGLPDTGQKADTSIDGEDYYVDNYQRYFPGNYQSGRKKIEQAKDNAIATLLAGETGIIMLNTHSLPCPIEGRTTELSLIIACQNNLENKNDIKHTFITWDDISSSIKFDDKNKNSTYLLIVNSCRSGAGEIHRLQDFDCLPVRFIKAGHHNFIYTLFKINTGLSKEFFQNFFDAFTMKRHAKSVHIALREAKLNIKSPTDDGDNLGHPRHWGSYTYAGNQLRTAYVYKKTGHRKSKSTTLTSS